MRSNKATTTLFALFVTAGLSACGNNVPSTSAIQESSAPKPRTHVIEMKGSLNFSPKNITIRKGDTIRWVNPSDAVHTVTAKRSLARDSSHVRLPAGAQPFHSGRVGPGDSYKRPFSVKGKYKYFCVPHERAGMIGTITVR